MARSVLFVCLGNIIRSPAAEAILQKLTQEIENLTIASCAIGMWSLGEPPDPRMVKAISKKGYAMTAGKRARLIQKQDFEIFDMLLAADLAVFQKLINTSPEIHKNKIHMLTAYSPRFKNESVPDPYYLDDKAFDRAAEMIEDSCQHLANFLKSQ